MSQSANHAPWYKWCLWYSQVNYLFAQLSSTWDDSNVLKKSQKRCNKAAVSCIFFSEVVTNLLFFERLQTTVSHTSAERFSARSKTIITINSVYIRSIKKRELVNVYREDIQSILRKQRPFPFLRNVIPPRSWVANQGPVRKIWLYFFKSR